MATIDTSFDFVLLGGSAGSLSAADALRAQGAKGSIVIIASEERLPHGLLTWLPARAAATPFEPSPRERRVSGGSHLGIADRLSEGYELLLGKLHGLRELLVIHRSSKHRGKPLGRAEQVDVLADEPGINR